MECLHHTLLTTGLRLTEKKRMPASILHLQVHVFSPIRRSFYFRINSRACAAVDTQKDLVPHEDNYRHSHHHFYHSHCHRRDHCWPGMNRFQEAILHFAKTIRWIELANFLRDNVETCCFSTILILTAAACPHVIPKQAVKPLQRILIFTAFPLISASAILDAVITVVGGKLNIHVLMTLAAFAFVLAGNSLEGGLLLALFNLSHIAEEYFTSWSMGDVRELKEKNPDYALVLERDGDELPHSSLVYKNVPVRDLEVGSYILIKAGQAIPVDGEVYQGSSLVTIEHLTGESQPLERTQGDRIPGGAQNLDGMLIVKALKTWEDSTLNRIVQMTEEAQLNKPKLQRWLDEFGEHYSWLVLVLSVVLALFGPFIFKWPFFSTPVCRGTVYRALGFLMAASPCALAVAPLAYATAISSCASKGILLKGGHVFDSIAACHTIAFDKTGTLSTGELMFKAIEPAVGHSRDPDKVFNCCIPDCEAEALAVAAAMGEGTTHPVGRAIVDYSRGRDLPTVGVESFESLPGRGICATLSGNELGGGDQKLFRAFLGSVDFIASQCTSNVDSQRIREAVRTSRYASNSVFAALSFNKKVTFFHFEEKPRPGTAEVVWALKNQARMRVIMLTGDLESSARKVAQAVGISEVHFNLQPKDKLNKVKNISRKTDGGVIMVGDGINDAPALAAAAVGIVISQHASATALNAADVLLLQDGVSGVPFCIAKACQTVSLVKQNVVLALLSIVFASLPSVLGVLPLWLTVLLHEGGTLAVCVNSVRALREPSWTHPCDFMSMFDKQKESFDVFHQWIKWKRDFLCHFDQNNALHAFLLHRFPWLGPI